MNNSSKFNILRQKQAKTVGELIDKLRSFDPNLKLSIYSRYGDEIYDFCVPKLFKDGENNSVYLDTWESEGEIHAAYERGEITKEERIQLSDSL